MKKLGLLADKIQPLFIALDPERDTPQIIGDYIREFDPRLVGPSQRIGETAREFRVFYQASQLGGGEYVFDHSSFIYLMDPNEKFANLLPPHFNSAFIVRAFCQAAAKPSLKPDDLTSWWESSIKLWVN